MPRAPQAAANTGAAIPPTLVGVTPSGLQAELGQPFLRRIDGPAQVWLYNSRVCRLDVIFYPGSAGQPQVALARPLPHSVSQASCLASLEQNRAS